PRQVLVSSPEGHDPCDAADTAQTWIALWSPHVLVWRTTLSCHSSHSNSVEIQTERGRTLFDPVRITSESSRVYGTNLSRRLGDGVPLWKMNWFAHEHPCRAQSASALDGL